MNKYKILRILNFMERVLQMLNTMFRPMLAYLGVYVAIQVIKSDVLIIFITVCAWGYILYGLVSFNEIRQKLMGTYEEEKIINLQEYKE